MEDRVIQIFESDQFRVRGYIDKDGTAWFNVEDVAHGLGITTVATSGNVCVRWARVNQYISEIQSSPSFQLSGKISLPLGKDDFIPENLVYRLAMKASNETAEKFQAWLADVVVPSIRQTGSYSLPNAADSSEKQTTASDDDLPPHIFDSDKLCVYILEMANGTVKIGMSRDFFRRANEIKTLSGLEVLNFYHTGYVPRPLAADLEKACHRAFSFCRRKGEFFSVTFVEACTELYKRARLIIETRCQIYEDRWPAIRAEYEKYLAEITVPPAIADVVAAAPVPEKFSPEKKIDLLFKIAEATKSDEFREQILHEAFEMVTGKKI